jgi:hypothetical protein
MSSHQPENEKPVRLTVSKDDELPFGNVQIG